MTQHYLPPDTYWVLQDRPARTAPKAAPLRAAPAPRRAQRPAVQPAPPVAPRRPDTVIKTSLAHFAALREQARQRAEQEQQERATQAAQSRAVLAELREQAPAAGPREAACASCGQAVRLSLTPRAEVFTVQYIPPANPMLLNLPSYTQPSPQPVTLARCEACRVLRDRAAAFAPEGARRDRAEAALCALAVLGESAETGLTLLVHHLWQAGQAIRWQVQARPGQCAPEPWAHVTEEDRAMLRRARAGMLAERLAAKRPPERIQPPEGDGMRGCLVCGVGHVEVPAVQVVRMGRSKAAAARELWHRYSMALPSPKGLQRREGHVCPACKAAQNAVGGNGPSARARALLDYLTAAGRTGEAAALRQALIEDESVTALLPAWCATGRVRPSERPWEHLGRLEF